MTSQDLKRVVMERNLSLIGYKGLTNIYHALAALNRGNVDGDFVETGAWRGGACMYARSVMNELGMKGEVYVCDSFNGLPRPDTAKYPLDEGDTHYQDEKLVVPLEEVRGYFEEFNLLEGVSFIEGWFKDTMPVLKEKVGPIAVLRLDGDMYQSTIEVLENLYDKVQQQGFVIVDDYGLDRCKWAVDDFVKKYSPKWSPLRVEQSTIQVWQKV